MTHTEARERAERGAALLDREEPGWADRINLSTFDLGDGCLCVLGQVYSRYAEGIKALALAEADSTDAEDDLGDYGAPYGFNLGTADYNGNRGLPSIHAAWSVLQHAWVQVIRQRQTPAPVQWTHRTPAGDPVRA